MIDPQFLHDDDSLDLDEMARASGVRVEIIVELVSHDILQPRGHEAREWRFPAPSIERVHRALRLRRDLDLNWPGVSLGLALLDELHDLRRRHRALLRRLG